jgi:hypothetical protein
MKIFRFYKGIIFFAVFSFLTFHKVSGQDPGTVVEFDITNNGKIQGDKEIGDYKVIINSIYYFNPEKKENQYIELSDNLFRFFDWIPYNGEIYEIEIIHFTDTMNVRFQKSDSSNHKPYQIWNAFFYFHIPFKPGYFEITDFKSTPYQKLTNSDRYKWKALKPDERKLKRIN